MKRLMILGATKPVVPMIKVAKNLGIYVITADNLMDSVGHQFSDEHCFVNILDQEAVLERAKRLKVDGVVAGIGCDLAAIPAAYVCERLGLPASGPYESVCVLQNKSKFREFLKEHDFETPWVKTYTDINDLLKDELEFEFPVMVKATDLCGNRGVSKVENKGELIEAAKHAIDVSRRHEFIVEEYIEANSYPSDSDCFSENGEFSFVSFSTKFFYDDTFGNISPHGYLWPQITEQEHNMKLKSELQRLIKLLDMKTSIYNVETRVGKNGKAFIMEVSPRGGGIFVPICSELVSGFPLIENQVRYSVGMPIVDNKENKDNGKYLLVFPDLKSHGVFKDLYIDKELQKYIVFTELNIKVGDYVYNNPETKWLLGAVLFRFDSDEMRMRVWKNLDSYVEMRTE